MGSVFHVKISIWLLHRLTHLYRGYKVTQSAPTYDVWRKMSGLNLELIRN